MKNSRKMESVSGSWIAVEISLRNTIGVAVEKDELETLPQTLKTLEENAEHYRLTIEKTQNELIVNHGTAAKVGADYILRTLAKRKK